MSPKPRRFVPPKHKRWQRYKPWLRLEFGNQCVYCRMPDTLNPRPDHFGVDHWRPQSLFPDLALDYENLFYACNGCNSRKRNFWGDPALTPRFIPNPCDHAMGEHLLFLAPWIASVTDAGEITAELLDLNEAEFLRHRSMIRRQLQDARANLRELEEQLEEIRSRLREAAGSQSENLQREERAVLDHRTITLERIGWLLGEA